MARGLEINSLKKARSGEEGASFPIFPGGTQMADDILSCFIIIFRLERVLKGVPRCHADPFDSAQDHGEWKSNHERQRSISLQGAETRLPIGGQGFFTEPALSKWQRDSSLRSE